MEEYLNAKAMVAPGAAGATVVTIAGTMATVFGIPGSYTALAVSFLFGLLVFSDRSLARLQRLVLYVVDSMIIFTVAVGLNSAGAAAMAPESVHERSADVPVVERPFFHPWF